MGFVSTDDVDCHQMLFLLHFLSFPLKRCQCFVCSEIYAFYRFDIVSKCYNYLYHMLAVVVQSVTPYLHTSHLKLMSTVM